MTGITSALGTNTVTGGNGAVDTGAAATKLAENMDAFLVMLTTQLKNQDPLSPMESAEFTNQLVGFAQVEQQIGINTNLQTLQTMQATTQNSLALSYLGRYAEIADNQVELKDGKARFAYILENDAKSTTITIKNAKGEVVREMTGDTLAGNHILDWNGKDAEGNALADGMYSIEAVSLVGQDLKEQKLTTVVQAKISAVSTGGTEPTLTVNGMAIPMSEVLTVSESMSL